MGTLGMKVLAEQITLWLWISNITYFFEMMDFIPEKPKKSDIYVTKRSSYIYLW